MSYKDKPQLKLYKYENASFVLQAIIDDFQEISFEHNLYEAGQFTISINYNIPNALKFERGLFVQFGSNPYDFGEILTVQDSIGEDGKGSQIRTITGYDSRYLLKRRVIKNMNSNGLWSMTGKGEIVLRNLIKDQCGSGAEAKRQLPITNVIPASESALGNEFSVSENFTNLYEVCKTIATQSEIGWRIKFDGTLTLEVYQGQDLSQTVRFDTNFESLANGEFSDSSESYTNAIYIGGKGQNDDRDIYEGEDGEPSGLDRFESWDNQSSMTTESEYEAEALSMLTQYGQTLTMNGNGLAKCPYIFREQYDIGDSVTVAFSGKSAKAQILSITEHWTWGAYDIQFSFGKPQNNLSDQLQLMLRKIQEASNKTNSTDSVRWYTIPTDTAMPKADVTYNTIGFQGTCAEGGSTFTLYLDTEKTGAKTYHVYFKQLAGGNLTLTTGRSGATDLVLNSGTYVAIIYVDENGNVTTQGATPTDVIVSGNTQPATSSGVAGAISQAVSPLQPINSITDGSLYPITSNAVADGKYQYLYTKALSSVGWYKIAEIGQRNMGNLISLDLFSLYYYSKSGSHKIQINTGFATATVMDLSDDADGIFDKIRICNNTNNTDKIAIYVHYTRNQRNDSFFNLHAGTNRLSLFNFETDSLTWDNTIEYSLGTSGLYINGRSYNTTNQVMNESLQPITSGAIYSLVGGANANVKTFSRAGLSGKRYVLLGIADGSSASTCQCSCDITYYSNGANGGYDRWSIHLDISFVFGKGSPLYVKGWTDSDLANAITSFGAIVITQDGTTSYLYFDNSSTRFALNIFPMHPLTNGRFAFKNPPTEEDSLTGTVVFDSRTDNEQHIKRIS